MAVQGTWTAVGDVLTGVLGQGFTWAYCLAGAETDSNYVVSASVKLVGGQKASVIAAFTYDVNFNPIFIECLLDVADQLLEVDLVNVGARTPVAQRKFALAAGVVYPVQVESGVDSVTGNPYVVFSVGGVEQIRVEDLSSLFLAGMHGYGLWGASPSNSAVFSSPLWQSIPVTAEGPPAIISVSDVQAELNASYDPASLVYTVFGLTVVNSAFQAHVSFANLYVNALVGSELATTDPPYNWAKMAALNLACLRVLVAASGGMLLGAFDYRLGDLYVTKGSISKLSFETAVARYQTDFQRVLVNFATAAATADVKAAGEVPTYRGSLISP